MKEWNSPVYAFFNPKPQIVHINGRHAHDFKCAGSGCKVTVCRFLDTQDAQLTSNLRKHVKSCWRWGSEVLSAADCAKDANEVHTKIVKKFMQEGTITLAFERKGKGKVTYSNRQHTRHETR